ncbi:hypothetical protein RND81_09G219100 [Saponaria officinalis]|uniref:EF-hand domain-containing protein n=1 Tax=Saponaria officinalis TaxID=3572 RepID=A0AAW1IRI8_SAPOF
MLVTIDGPMITKFIENTTAFNECAEKRFKALDLDGDGVLTRDDLRGALGGWLIAMDMDSQSNEEIKRAYDSIFEKFNAGNNSINCENFRSMLVEIMLAMARGIGNTPMNVLLDEDSLLLNACVNLN